MRANPFGVPISSIVGAAVHLHTPGSCFFCLYRPSGPREKVPSTCLFFQRTSTPSYHFTRCRSRVLLRYQLVSTLLYLRPRRLCVFEFSALTSTDDHDPYLPHINGQQSFDNHNSTYVCGLQIVPWTLHMLYFVSVVIAREYFSVLISDSVLGTHYLVYSTLCDVLAISCSILILGDFMFIFDLFSTSLKTFYLPQPCIFNKPTIALINLYIPFSFILFPPGCLFYICYRFISF
jgi:hypothetical protein